MKLLTIRILLLITLFTGCFSHNIGNKFDDPMNAYLKMFMSSSLTPGDMSLFIAGIFTGCSSLSGINRANCACNIMAKQGGAYSTRDYRAWLSSTAVDARCNILGQESNADDCGLGNFDADSLGPWLNYGSYEIIFKTYTDLIEYSLENAPLSDESGTKQAAKDVWTGTDADGRLSSGGTAINCNDWTAGASGIVGNSGFTGSSWTNNTSMACSGSFFSIYCFEQPDL